MSEVALLWVDGLTGLDPTSKSILARLARFADDDDCAWCRVDDLALHVGASTRTIQSRLRKLEACGYLADTGRTHRLGTRDVPIRELLVDHARVAELLATRKARRVSERAAAASMGANPAPIKAPMGAAVCTRMGATVCTPKNRNRQEEGEADASPSGGGAREPDAGFEELRRVWPNRVDTDEAAARTAFAAAAAEVGADRVVAAARAWVAEQARLKRDHGAPALQRWLQRRTWAGFLPDVGAAELGRAGRGLAAFAWPELRAEVVAARGEGFAVSFLDPCEADEAGRVLRPATMMAAERLARDVGAELRRHGVMLGEVRRRAG